jgi:acyl carrier protein
VDTGFQARAGEGRNQMDLNHIDRNTSLHDLGPASLDTVELVMAIEEAFDIQVPDEEAEKFQTIGDIIDYIEQHAKQKESRESLLKKLWNVIQEILFGIKKK